MKDQTEIIVCRVCHLSDFYVLQWSLSRTFSVRQTFAATLQTLSLEHKHCEYENIQELIKGALNLQYEHRAYQNIQELNVRMANLEREHWTGQRNAMFFFVKPIYSFEACLCCLC